MEDHSDFEIEEMREVAENIGRPRKNKKTKSFPYLITGAVLAVCLLLIFALSSKDGNKEGPDDITVIKVRIEQLAGKISQLEELGKKITEIEKQVKDSTKELSQLKGKDASLKKEINDTNQQISLLKDEIASVSGKTQTSGTVTKKRDYHVVQSGDSLLGVAKKYGMEIDELLRLNKFTLKTTIHPGQKIIIR